MTVATPTPARARSPAYAARRHLVAGAAIIAVCLVGSLTWAALAPLATAAIAPGTVVVDSRRKVVQHLEGGIVREVLVREGDRVAAGQPLVVLDGTQMQAEAQSLRGRLIDLEARRARLIAERDGLAEIVFAAAALADPGAPGAAAAMAAQSGIFAARRALLHTQEDIARRRIAQLHEQIAGLEGQVSAADRRIALLREELRGVSDLVDAGYERRPRMLTLQREMAEVMGDVAQFQGSIAEARQRIGEAELSILDLKAQHLSEAVTELGDVLAQIAEVEEKLRIAADRAARTTVRAPTAGLVVDLRVAPEGGVVAPGGELLDLVPLGDDLVVDAMVRPSDIDVVRPGLPADIRLTAFPSRTVKPLRGRVVTVSADRLVDPESNAPYYRARIVINPESLSRFAASDYIYPGMQAEVMIETGRRTALDIAFSPLLDSMNRAFRE